MRGKYLLLAILLIGFVYRVYVLLNSQISFYSDDAIYAELARFWLEGKYYQAFHPTWPPLYPAISAATYLIIPKWELALQLVSTFSLLGLLVVLFVFVTRKLGKVWALIYTLTLGFLSPILKLSLFPISDMLATALVLSSLVSIYYALEQAKTKYFIVAGILLGTTFLVRAEGTLFFSLSLVYLILVFTLSFVIRTYKKVNLLKNILLLIVTFGITISPYVILTQFQLGRWTLSQKFSAQIKQGHSFELRNGSTWSQEIVSIKEPNYSSSYFSGGLPHLLDYSDWYWWWFKQKTVSWQKVFLKLLPLWSLIIILIGALPRLKKATFFSENFFNFIIVGAIPITIFSTTISDIRYLLWTIPLALFYFLRGIKRITLNKKFGIIVALILLFKLPLLELHNIIKINSYAEDFTRSYYRPEILAASNWINTNSSFPEPGIFMRHEGIEFYTNGVTIYIPQEKKFEEVLSYAKEKGAHYFVAWTEEIAHDKNLSYLLGANANPEGLKKVFSTNNLVLYEIVY